MSEIKGKILFYNTAPLGLGHLVRSVNICKSLVESFEVDFVLGSLPLAVFPKSSTFTLHQLPPLIRHYEKGPLIDPQGKKSEDALRLLRKEMIKKIVTKKYDFFISEHFPLGRHFLVDEILTLIECIKEKNPSCKIIGSFRGEKKINKITKPWIDNLISQYFDYILVHVDPNVTRIDPFLEHFPYLKYKFLYTGYVTDPTFKPQILPRKKQIVIALGAGSFGEELMYAVLKVAPLMPHFHFLFILGPKVTTKVQKELKDSETLLNVTFTGLLDNFVEVLSESALAITLGGAGTTADLLQTRTPAIIYPHEVPKDQESRGRIFSEKGFARVITGIDLEPSKLYAIIQEVLSAPLPHYSVNIEGAKNTTQALLEIMKESNLI